LSKKLNQHEKITQFHVSVSNLSFLSSSKVNKLVQFFKENGIDVVLFNSPKDLKLGGKAAQKAGVATVIYRRGIAVEVKGSRLNKRLFQDVVTHFIFNSKATKQLLEKNHKEIVDTKKSAVIYNAIEFSNDKEESPKNYQVIIGNAGRLVEQKGQFHLIDIAKKLKQKGVHFELQIAGDGPLREDLKKQINQEGLNDCVKLFGFVNDMKAFMKGIDIFVSTALWEGFGFVLAEAMTAQKPVLAFDLSSNPELINDGENGYLIPEKNTDLFAAKLEYLCQHDEVRSEMGKAAFQFALDNFEKDMQFKKLLAFISC
jgi:glycosyltransferase involved in cell wall biosynthesis